MFYKINNKFYIKTASYYKEVEFDGKEFKPSTKENTRLYEVKEAIPYTLEAAVEEVKKTIKKSNFKNIEEI